MKRQRGAALILVLMLAAILGMLTLQIGLTAREQVARAQVLAARVEAQLRAHSRETALQFTLLTESWGGRDASARNPYAAAWNFRGQSFTVDGVTYRIQDLNGLMPVPYLSGQPFARLASELGADEARARALGEALMQLQGAPETLPALGSESTTVDGLDRLRGGPVTPLQSLAQLLDLPGMDGELFAKLAPLLTLYPVQGFNALTAPAEVLAIRLPSSTLRSALEARARGELDDATLLSLTGIGNDDATSSAPGPAFRIRLELVNGGIAVRRDTTVVVQPYRDEALVVWSRRGPGDGLPPPAEGPKS